jgi:hypothetical protein
LDAAVQTLFLDSLTGAVALRDGAFFCRDAAEALIVQ